MTWGASLRTRDSCIESQDGNTLSKFALGDEV